MGVLLDYDLIKRAPMIEWIKLVDPYRVIDHCHYSRMAEYRRLSTIFLPCDCFRIFHNVIDGLNTSPIRNYEANYTFPLL